jgi:hypothetical protein
MTLYSAAMRRAELRQPKVSDLDNQGKSRSRA